MFSKGDMIAKRCISYCRQWNNIEGTSMLIAE